VGGIVTEVVIVVSHGEAILQNPGGELAHLHTDLIGEGVAQEAISTGLTVVDPRDGVGRYGGNGAGPSIGDSQIVVTVGVGLAAAGGADADGVVWLELIREVGTVGNRQARIHLVTDVSTDASGVEVVILTNRSVQVVGTTVVSLNVVRCLTVTTCIAGSQTELEVGTALLIRAA
jgi:hypothetical protein